MITFKHKGDFSKTIKYLKDVKQPIKIEILELFAKEGVKALSSATPIESGLTADSWDYQITSNKNGASIKFNNSNINKNVPIAIILQYGHGTGTGGWVEGRDYINPAIQPVFDKIVEEAWKEVTKL